MKPTRLFFLDAVRAFAILLMLQGHFIDTLLNPVYKNVNNIAYSIWLYFRGITAPVFFTITGLVFVYLLFKSKVKGTDNIRIKKGLLRGLMLILIGYILRISFLGLIFGNLDLNVIKVDVLQCIGVSIILLIFLYTVSFKNEWVFAFILLVLGLIIFVSEPLYRNLNIESIPIIFSNYLSKQNGSVFTIFPWFGYVCFGGFLAILFYKFDIKKNYKKIKIISFFIVGLFLAFYSSQTLRFLDKLLDIHLLTRSANYNYLFSRLGNVLMLFGVFYLFENYLKHNMILKIGQKTLSIYVIHFIIIYGSITDIGLKNFFYNVLTPTQSIIGAVCFMVCVCFISFHYVKTNTYLYGKIRRFYRRLKN